MKNSNASKFRSFLCRIGLHHWEPGAFSYAQQCDYCLKLSPGSDKHFKP